MKTRKHNLSQYKLNVLKDLTFAINNNATKEELIDFFLMEVAHRLGIQRILLYIKNKGEWENVIRRNVDEKLAKQIRPEVDLPETKDIVVISPEKYPDLKDFDIIIPVHHNDEILAYLIIGDIMPEILGLSPSIKHLAFIQTLLNIIIVAIENKRLSKESMQQAIQKKEMDLASAMQQKLIPLELPGDEYFSVASLYVPHQFIGGDYFDFFRISHDTFLFCIADVSGKGIPAALIMSNLQAAIKIIIQYTQDLEEIVRKLNSLIYENTKGEKFITFFICKYSLTENKMEYINCAHFPPIFIDKDELHYLNSGAIMLGAFPDMKEIETGSVLTSPGAILIAYTDGVCELQNNEQQPFGIERLARIVFDNRHQPINQIVKKIEDALWNYAGENGPGDDITLIGIKRK
ncbi:MAG: hypothetical protein KatS3mg034_1921 [Vicingaceae bacterium]|nr:MAG: hypothetical protein KatS3mg034_1921 [Vicingaceae bacterium]